MIDRRVPGAGNVSEYRPQRDQWKADTRNTGCYFTTAYYTCDGQPITATITSISERTSRLLSGDYIKDRPQSWRVLAGAAAGIITGKITHSPDVGVASFFGTIITSELPLIRGLILSAKQDKAEEALKDDASTLHFRNDAIKLERPLGALPGYIDFTNIESGLTEHCPTGALVDSLIEIPGLQLKRSGRRDTITGELSSGTLVGFMLGVLKSNTDHNKFINLNYIPLKQLSRISTSLPENSMPAFEPVRAELETDMLQTSLGLYASFVALRRERVATALDDYDIALPLQSPQLLGPSARLRDMSIAVPLSQVEAYGRSIPC